MKKYPDVSMYLEAVKTGESLAIFGSGTKAYRAEFGDVLCDGHNVFDSQTGLVLNTDRPNGGHGGLG